MHLRKPALGMIVCVGFLAPYAARAETFVLKNGGRVTGKVLNPQQSPRRQFIIELVEGGRVTIDVSRVKQILKTRPEELEYEKVRRNYEDTVVDHWVLAEWCRTKKLLAQREKHLLRICELEPDHLAARQALGHVKLGGRWLNRDEWMVRQGYRRFEGRYRTTQEIDLLKARRAREKAEKEWYIKIKLWRGWLETRRDAEGRGSLNAITDPHAVAALSKELAGERAAPMRLMFVEILARIGTPDASHALKIRSMEDSDSGVRMACLDHLVKFKRPALTEYYVGKLRDRDNDVVRRAAVALSRVADPSAIRPLIDALITTHKQKNTAMKTLGSIGAGFSKDGTSSSPGLSMGNPPKYKKVQLPNQSVRDALFNLTGQNFGFDQQAWRDWHAAQLKVRSDINLRRD